jgi:hypothetical protein
VCTETKNVSAALGEQHVLDQPAPILTVNDPRMDSADNWKRRKVLAALAKLLPASARPAECAMRGHLPPYNQGDSRVTIVPGANGNYKMLLVGEENNSCAPFNGSVMTLIGASGKWGFHSQYGADDDGTGTQKMQDGWVSYAPGLLPSVGDVFVLYSGREAHHCGVVCEVGVKDMKLWFTGDGGQPDRTGPLHRHPNKRWGWRRSYVKPDPNYPPDLQADLNAHEAAYLVPRVLDCSDENNPQLANFFIGGGGETLHGWRNVTHPKVNMKPLSHVLSGAEDDYQNLKQRINALRDAVTAEWKQRAAPPP